MKVVDNVKSKFDEMKKSHYRKKLEKERDRLIYQKEKFEEGQEKLRKEEETYKKEYDRLCSLSEKEVQAEMILAIRGLYLEHKINEDNINEIKEELEEIQIDIGSVRGELEELKEKENSND